MTDTRDAPGKTIEWESVVPTFHSRLRAPKKPPRPSDGAIVQAQRSWDGRVNEDGETEHVMRHRFATEEMAQIAADELKRAGYYTEPETTVSVTVDPDNAGDKRIIAWLAGGKRGRKAD